MKNLSKKNLLFTFLFILLIFNSSESIAGTKVNVSVSWGTVVVVGGVAVGVYFGVGSSYGRNSKKDTDTQYAENVYIAEDNDYTEGFSETVQMPEMQINLFQKNF